MNAVIKILPMLFTVALATGCRKPSVSMSELQEELEALKVEAREAKKAALDTKHQFAALMDAVEKIDTEINADRSIIRECAQRGETLVQDYANYRTQYREAIQKRAPGMTLADFQTADGTYSAVRIRQLDSWQVSIQHKNGFTKLPLADLPDDLKKLLAYDPSLATQPSATVASAPAVNVYVPTAPLQINPSSPSNLNVAAAPPPSAPSCENKQVEESKKLYGDSSIITLWGRLSAGSSATGGGQIRSSASNLPPGYKPIGSSYSGSAMDKLHKPKSHH